MRPFHVEKLAVMMNLANSLWIGVGVCSDVEHDRIVSPRTFPQFVQNAANHGGQLESDSECIQMTQ